MAKVMPANNLCGSFQVTHQSLRNSALPTAARHASKIGNFDKSFRILHTKLFNYVTLCGRSLVDAVYKASLAVRQRGIDQMRRSYNP